MSTTEPLRTRATAFAIAGAAARYASELLWADDHGAEAAAALDAVLAQFGSLWPEVHAKLLTTLDECEPAVASTLAADCAIHLLVLGSLTESEC